LSGGSGTRLWPLSRQLYPKQLLPLVDQATMLQQTALRISGRANIGQPIVSCNEQHRFLVAEQLREIDIEPVAILLEPTGRNTAPAAAVAAIHAINSTPNDNPLLLVLPADHVIADPSAFLAALDLAEAAALAGDLVTFGVVPTRAETGYGYIRSRAKPGGNNNGVRAVAEFVEKPTEAVAAEYVQSGDYLWNSGMFLFSAAAYLEELRRFAPAIADACKATITEASVDLDFLRLDCDAFTECPNDSIDFAVMEKTDRAVVVPLDAGWSDVGSFGALFDVLTKDANGNVFAGDVVAVAETEHGEPVLERRVRARDGDEAGVLGAGQVEDRAGKVFGRHLVHVVDKNPSSPGEPNPGAGGRSISSRHAVQYVVVQFCQHA